MPARNPKNPSVICNGLHRTEAHFYLNMYSIGIWKRDRMEIRERGIEITRIDDR
jgi:hypothetical protein